MDKKPRDMGPWSEDFSCPCCDEFYSGWAFQQADLNADDADALYEDLREMMRDGFARYAYPLLGQLIMIEPDSRRVRRMSRLRIEQLNLSRKSAADQNADLTKRPNDA